MCSSAARARARARARASPAISFFLLEDEPGRSPESPPSLVSSGRGDHSCRFWPPTTHRESTTTNHHGHHDHHTTRSLTCTPPLPHPTKQPHFTSPEQHQRSTAPAPHRTHFLPLPLPLSSLPHPSSFRLPLHSIPSFPPLFFCTQLQTPLQHHRLDIITRRRSNTSFNTTWRRTFRHLIILPSSATGERCSCPRENPSVPVARLATNTTPPPPPSMTRNPQQMTTIQQRNQVAL
jgi:hypothetical protein